MLFTTHVRAFVWILLGFSCGLVATAASLSLSLSLFFWLLVIFSLFFCHISYSKLCCCCCGLLHYSTSLLLESRVSRLKWPAHMKSSPAAPSRKQQQPTNDNANQKIIQAKINKHKNNNSGNIGRYENLENYCIVAVAVAVVAYNLANMQLFFAFLNHVVVPVQVCVCTWTNKQRKWLVAAVEIPTVRVLALKAFVIADFLMMLQLLLLLFVVACWNPCDLLFFHLYHFFSSCSCNMKYASEDSLLWHVISNICSPSLHLTSFSKNLWLPKFNFVCPRLSLFY